MMMTIDDFLVFPAAGDWQSPEFWGEIDSDLASMGGACFSYMFAVQYCCCSAAFV